MAHDNRRDDAPPARFNPLAPGALGLPEGLIDRAEDVADALEHLHRLQVNLLAPLTRIDFIPPGYRLAFRAVVFPTDGQWVDAAGVKTNGTWYTTEGGGYALHKAALRQLAAAAGLSWETFDVSRELNRWIVKAVGRLRTMDGQWRQVSAMKDLDLRDDGPVLPTWRAEAVKGKRDAEKRILKAREFGGRMAESKAVNALIRDALGLRASYPENLARRAFVFPLLIFCPDTPEARQLQAAVELGVVGQLYGPATVGRAFAEAGTVIDSEPPARPALPEPAAPPPDFQAEAERLNQRERAPVAERQRSAPPAQASRAPATGRATEDELRGYCRSRGWDAPDTGARWAGLRAYVTGDGAADFARYRSEAAAQDANPDHPDW